MSAKTKRDDSHEERQDEIRECRSVLDGETVLAARADEEIARKCRWVTVYQGQCVRCFKISVVGGVAGPGETIELEVEVDGKTVTTLGTGQSTRVCGKTIRVHAKARFVVYTVTPF